MNNFDNLFAAAVCIGGIISCVRLFLRHPSDRLIAILVGLVLAFNAVSQFGVIINLNRALGNGWYEVSAEMLIIVAVLLIVTRRGHDGHY